MKTKYLIAMLAAPMFFAACSQEDLIDSVPGTEKIEGTPYGNELVFNVGDRNDASTRITTDGQWSTGDQIGMAWISDGYKDGSSYTEGKLVTGVFGNEKNVIGNVPLNFVSGTSFKSHTMMFVGTYLAYYPFNEGLKEVGELKLSVGANQTSKDLEDAYNKMIFASDTLSLQAENAGTGKTPVIGMKRLSNMLALEIYLKENSTTMPAPVIQKVELDLQNSSNGSLLATSGTVVPGKWVVGKTNVKDKNYFNNIEASDGYLTPADLGEITVTTTEDLAVSKDNGATVYLSFMPSDLTSNAIDAGNSVLNIYTNYGVIKSSVANAIKFYNLNASKYEAAADIKEAFDPCDKVAGRLIKKKVEIDLSKVDVDGLTATNTAEVRSIISNWKLKGSDAGNITINVTHDADYLKNFDKNEASGKTCKNIKLEGLDLSDIPGELTIQAKDTLEFEGTTNLNAVNKGISITDEAGTGAKAVIFNGETSIGTLTANSLIAFNGNTTINGTLTQVPAAAENKITVAAGKTLTVNSGELISNTANYSTLVNSGTISLISSGAINKGAGSQNLTINNFAAIEGATPTAYNEGTINIGDAESQGYLAGTDAGKFDNEHGTVRFFNGEYVAPGEGSVLAVAQNALQFSAAVDKNVTTIEVIGNIDFSKIDLNEAKGKATTVVMKSGSKLSMGTKAITLSNVKVAENATIEGKQLTVFKGKLEVMPNVTLTVGDNTTIKAKTLDLPTAAQIEGDAKTSVVVYKEAGLVGGTYTANISHDSNLIGVE